MIVLNAGNDNLIELVGLIDNETSIFINNATVTATLFDSSETQVASISLVYRPSSEGEYEGTLPAATTLDVGARYRLDISAVGSNTALWQIPVRVLSRIS